MFWYQTSSKHESDNPNKMRCSEITLQQNVCKRKVMNKGDFCWQHPRDAIRSKQKRASLPKPKAKAVPLRTKMMKKKARPKPKATQAKAKAKIKVKVKQRSSVISGRNAPRDSAMDFFRRMDANNSGRISVAEWRANWKRSMIPIY